MRKITTQSRMRIRAYVASFRPHSNILNLSQPSDWTDWLDGYSTESISEALIDTLASIVDPQQQAPHWVFKLEG